VTKVLTPKKWQITGTFPCKTKEDFDSEEVPASLPVPWPETLQAGGKSLPVHELESDHTWVNFHRLYFTKTYTPFALTEQAVYARGMLESSRGGKATIRVAFDDWMTLWLNGEKLATLCHEDDFKSAEIPVRLKKGSNEILVKSVNFDRIPNNRLWAFSLIAF
jgi:hypothetical protein